MSPPTPYLFSPIHFSFEKPGALGDKLSSGGSVPIPKGQSETLRWQQQEDREALQKAAGGAAWSRWSRWRSDPAEPKGMKPRFCVHRFQEEVFHCVTDCMACWIRM